MKIRNLVMLCAAAASTIVGSTASMADNIAPLPAGGPAAQSEAGGLSAGTIIEIGGALFAVTIAGLIAVNSDSSASNTLAAPATTSTTSTSST